MADRSLRTDLLGRDVSLGRTLAKGARDVDRFGSRTRRSFERAGDDSGRRYGMRLSKSLGGGITASTGIVTRGARVMGGAFAAIGVAKLGTDSVRMAATFDKTMRQTAAVAKVPTRQLGELRDVALDMGAKTSFSAREAGNAMLELGKGGLTFAQMKAGALNSTLVLAAAGGIELGESAGYIVKSLKTFGLGADQAGAAAAALAGGANASTASVEDMGLALSQVGPGARTAGLSIQETTAVLASFADNGIRGADAGTSLKTMLTRLVPQTNQQAAAMKRLGLDFVDAHGAILPITEIAQQLQNRLKGLSQAQRIAALNTVFGSDATRAATVLMNEGSAGLAKYIRATSDRAAAEKLAKTNTEGAAGAFERLSGAIETIQIKAGDTLLPMLADAATTIADRVLPAVSKWVGAFRDDLLPHLGRMKQAWDANKGALAGLVTGLAGSQGTLTSTGDKARTLADSVVAVSNAAGDASRFLTSLGNGLNTVDSTLDRVGSAIHEDAIAPLYTLGKGIGDTTGLTGVFNRIIGDTKADLADLGVKFGQNAEATGRSTTAADRHTAALRNEKDAVDALKNALRGEEAAELDVRQAKLNVSSAQTRLTALISSGRRGSIEYKQAQIDLKRAQIDLRQKTDEYKTAAQRATAATGGAMRASQAAGATSDRVKVKTGALGTALRRAGEDALVMGGRARSAITGIPSRNVKIVANFGWQGLEVFQVGGGLRAFAVGGQVRGPGTATSDSIPAMLSAGEHVLSAREVQGMGGHGAVEQMRSQARGFATGGAVLDAQFPASALDRPVDRFGATVERILDLATSRFKALAKRFGGGSPAIKAFIHSTDALPYIWGGAGPGGYDCSGIVSAVLGKMTGAGGGSGQRYFTTASIRPGILGIKSGLGGTLQIGVTAGSGHMAGRYGGLGFEAESTATGIKTGSAASTPESFARHYHLARGGPVERRMVAQIAQLTGADIGGDPGRIRVNDQTFDRGGYLQPGTTLAHNRTGRPERVLGPGEAPVQVHVELKFYGPVIGSPAAFAREVTPQIRANLKAELRREGKVALANQL